LRRGAPFGEGPGLKAKDGQDSPWKHLTTGGQE
jgi:hypothetical protein